MWDNFFTAGGWGMFPTLLFGFLLLAASALALIRREARLGRVARVMSGATLASGLLGTCFGISTTVHYAATLPPADQVFTVALGLEESLHVVVLALLFVVPAALIRALAAFREAPDR
jgi:hypothetical protein